ncbi:MAG: LysM peptidoglycan-binding domain-containing protein [Acidobacteria bacterium]|nr:LysM peptidoglycan-binding domain-containing protein [Acidobacteriota bacterium]
MQEYTVRAGDSLSKIAEKLLGSAGRWRLLAEANELADPNQIRVGQILRIPSLEPAVAPAVLNPSHPPPDGDLSDVVFSVEGNKVFALLVGSEERIYVGTRFRLGLFRNGRIRPEEALERSSAELDRLRLSDSERHVLDATAENEGALDAINTWDNSFLSFGMFQWTAGPAGAPGELASLLGRIQSNYPEEFQHYFGRFGLALEGLSGGAGWISLNNRRLVSEEDKQPLRDFKWALRFIRAGEDAKIQTAQLLHAIGRLDQFYFEPQERLGGLAFSELITSEYGVALLLDNHVNRPAFVVGTLERALEQLGRTPQQLASSGDERPYLKKYLEVRADFGGTRAMTDSDRRAQVTRSHVTSGLISESRGTFVSHRQQRNA